MKKKHNLYNLTSNELMFLSIETAFDTLLLNIHLYFLRNYKNMDYSLLNGEHDWLNFICFDWTDSVTINEDYESHKEIHQIIHDN